MMSGTSGDGVDAVLVRFRGNVTQPNWQILNNYSILYPYSLRKKVINVGQSFRLSSSEWLELSEEITQVYSQAALKCDPDGRAEIVGCHGQTVWHRPPTHKKKGASMQILQPQMLSQLLNKPIIYDFRTADLLLGGHGAPLVPLLDHALIGRTDGWRGVLNLGGIANLSLIPPKSGPERLSNILGWDCGPANSLIDLAISQITKEKYDYDKDGLFAAEGKSDENIIKIWLKEPFFQRLPPKSTGREQFGLKDLENRKKDVPDLSESNLIATLTAFSAAVIAQDLYNLSKISSLIPNEIFITGGGCKNPVLFKEIQSRCLGITIKSIEDLGIPVQFREALSFALLAWWNILKHNGNSPYVTGASRSCVLGSRVYPV